MTINFGNVPLGETLPVHFGSYNSAGASVALTGLAITDVLIYKGTTVTQRSSTAGIVLIDTDGIDIDGIVGANGFSIDTSDNTDAGFYAAGSFYNVWVSAVTIDSQTVNFLAATFRIVPAEDGTAGAPVVDVGYWRGTAAAFSTASNGSPFVDVGYFDGTAVTAALGIPEVKVASLAANAITATTINADAITAAKVAADVGAEIADAVWDEALAGHAGAGSAGAALTAVGDPWTTALPGAYGAGTAGKIIGDNINATITSRASQASLDVVDGIADNILLDTAEIGAAGAGLTALASQTSVNTIDDFLDTEIAAIKAKTDNLPASPAAVGSAMTLTTAYDFAKGTAAMTESYAANGAAPTAAQALFAIHQMLMHFGIAGTSVTVKKLDNTTTAFVVTLDDATTPTSAERV